MAGRSSAVANRLCRPSVIGRDAMGVRLDRWACGALYDRIRLTTMEEALPERGPGGGGPRGRVGGPSVRRPLGSNRPAQRMLGEGS